MKRGLGGPQALAPLAASVIIGSLGGYSVLFGTAGVHTLVAPPPWCTASAPSAEPLPPVTLRQHETGLTKIIVGESLSHARRQRYRGSGRGRKSHWPDSRPLLAELTEPGSATMLAGKVGWPAEGQLSPARARGARAGRAGRRSAARQYDRAAAAGYRQLLRHLAGRSQALEPIRPGPPDKLVARC